MVMADSIQHIYESVLVTDNGYRLIEGCKASKSYEEFILRCAAPLKGTDWLKTNATTISQLYNHFHRPKEELSYSGFSVDRSTCLAASPRRDYNEVQEAGRCRSSSER
jgi:hypothetical protein